MVRGRELSGRVELDLIEFRFGRRYFDFQEEGLAQTRASWRKMPGINAGHPLWTSMSLCWDIGAEWLVR